MEEHLIWPTTEEHLKYLDNLRESGATNMWGTVPYIQDEFPDLSKEEAKHILVDWMEGFAVRHKIEPQKRNKK